MSKELSTVEESVKEALIELMTKILMSKGVMSMGVQASLTRGVQAFPSIARGSGPS
jgi:hypothetical protein